MIINFKTNNKIPRIKGSIPVDFIPIKGYNDYYINKQGVVISTHNCKLNTYIIVKSFLEKSGYIRIKLFNNKGNRKTLLVHRLVAIAFIPNPNDLPEINHKDHNRINNHPDNLEWCSIIYNNNYDLHLRVYKTPSHAIKIKKININTGVITLYTSITQASKKSKIGYKGIYDSLRLNKILYDKYKFSYYYEK